MAITSEKPLHEKAKKIAQDKKMREEKAEAEAEHSAEYVMLEKIYEDLWD